MHPLRHIIRAVQQREERKTIKSMDRALDSAHELERAAEEFLVTLTRAQKREQKREQNRRCQAYWDWRYADEEQ